MNLFFVFYASQIYKKNLISSTKTNLICNFASVEKKRLYIVLGLFFLFSGLTYAQRSETDRPVPPGGALLEVEINKRDTTFIAHMSAVNVFPRQQFSNKRQEQFYWRTVRDIKKTLPFAKLVGEEMRMTNKALYQLPNDKARKEYLAKYEKELFAKYEPVLRKFTINQGKMLIKLIDRECQQSSYDLIRLYRGGFTAFFWQGVAYIFGTNLKSEYDPQGEDRIIEQIIQLVESGQL